LGDADQRHDIAPDADRYPQGLNCFLEGIGLNTMVDFTWGIVYQSDNSPKKRAGTISGSNGIGVKSGGSDRRSAD
jgi:hypothetical protein